MSAAVYAEALRNAEVELAELEVRRESLLHLVGTLRQVVAAERTCEIHIPTRMLDLIIPALFDSEAPNV